MTEQKGLTNSTYHEVIGGASQPDALPEVRSIKEVPTPPNSTFPEIIAKAPEQASTVETFADAAEQRLQADSMQLLAEKAMRKHAQILDAQNKAARLGWDDDKLNQVLSRIKYLLWRVYLIKQIVMTTNLQLASLIL